MKDAVEEANRWIAQADNDLQFAKLALSEKFWSQCCFMSQQSAEKAVKSIFYHKGHRIVIGHSIFQLFKKITEPVREDLIEMAKILDQFYIAARYPNGIPGGAPYEVFTEKQAAEAVKAAGLICEWAYSELQSK